MQYAIRLIYYIPKLFVHVSTCVGNVWGQRYWGKITVIVDDKVNGYNNLFRIASN